MMEGDAMEEEDGWRGRSAGGGAEAEAAEEVGGGVAGEGADSAGASSGGLAAQGLDQAAAETLALGPGMDGEMAQFDQVRIVPGGGQTAHHAPAPPHGKLDGLTVDLEALADVPGQADGLPEDTPEEVVKGGSLGLFRDRIGDIIVVKFASIGENHGDEVADDQVAGLILMPTAHGQDTPGAIHAIPLDKASNLGRFIAVASGTDGRQWLAAEVQPMGEPVATAARWPDDAVEVADNHGTNPWTGWASLCRKNMQECRHVKMKLK